MFFKVFVVVVILLGLSTGPGLARPQVGDTAPALKGVDIDGKSFDLKDMKGKVVIINYWATWCGPCREEMPELSAFYRAYKSKGVELLGISFDRKANSAVVKEVAHLYKIPAALHDTITNDFGEPSALPITFFIDQRGVVYTIHSPTVARMTYGYLEELIGPMLANPPKADEEKKSSVPETNAQG